ncbi:MAG: glycosyltransferase family 39 protein [Candidatus Peribacteraceae bacterium]|nr:glycosyltransferase family 39 protein [Candidatus Peribacteraceae bacterium]
MPRITRTTFALLCIIFIGIALRAVDLGFPDVSTDEAQFVLGASAAHPPLGMALFRFGILLGGPVIIVARAVSAILGVLTLVVMYFIALHLRNRQTALLVAAVAAVVPSHILFSRLAYLAVPLTLAWLAALLLFLLARRDGRPVFILLLFLCSVSATFVKAQGLVFPLLLLLGRIIEKRRLAFRDPVTIVLALSLIPILFFVVTHPGLPATLFLYGGNMFGLSHASGRMMALLQTWWPLLLLFFPFLLISIPMIRLMPWPAVLLLLTGPAIALLLGPDHPYYATDLVCWALPVALLLGYFPAAARHGVMIALTVNAFLILTPRAVSVTPWTYSLVQTPGYWNAHADTLNTLMMNETLVIALGATGHHVRWYLMPEVLVGNDMDLTRRNGMFLLLDKAAMERIPGATVVYEDERLIVAKR